MQCLIRRGLPGAGWRWRSPREGPNGRMGGVSTTPPPSTPPGDGAPGDDGGSPGRGRTGERAGAAARGVGSGARATGRGVRGVARGAGRAGRYTLGQARRAANAEGADESGLSRLIGLHAVHAAGDAAVAIALAGTLFFQAPTGEARGQVALFLGLTMLPFAIVAPLIGPFLDRFSHGRRWAIGATMALRAFLCWVLADAVLAGSPVLFGAALGVLVCSKAYGVTRAAAVPRLLPASLSLVRANARVSLAGVVGASLSAPVAVLAATAGAGWALRYAFVVFVVATVLAILLPEQVDASAGEQALAMPGEDPEPVPGTGPDAGRAVRRATRIPAAVAFALRANCGPRWLTGFLVMFMAFLLRENPLPGWEDRPELLLGLVVAGAGIGNTLGIVAASVLRRIDPAATVVGVLVADALGVALGAALYGVATIVALGLVAGLAQSLGKVSLDSTIQVGVPPSVQASAFARSDTTLQLAWVVGGFVGIAMPLIPRLGLGVAAAVLVTWAAYVLLTRPGSGRSTSPF